MVQVFLSQWEWWEKQYQLEATIKDVECSTIMKHTVLIGKGIGTLGAAAIQPQSEVVFQMRAFALKG